MQEVAPPPPTPPYNVRCEGSYDWSVHKAAPKNPYFHETVPETLHVEVSLPDISTMKEVRVDVSPKLLRIFGVDDDDTPMVTVPFPVPVQEEPISPSLCVRRVC